MPFKYKSGEEIVKGDSVLLSGDSGVVEFIADPLVDDPDTRWYVMEFGGGIMISQLEHLGSVFDEDPASDEDLEFVSRQTVNMLSSDLSHD